MTASRLPLRLLGQRLTQNDVAKIGVFLRIGQHKLQYDWSLVDGGEVDVLIVSGDHSDTVPGLLNNPRATLYVVDASTPADPRRSAHTALVRPLQYESFIDELSRLERSFVGHADAPALVAAPPVEVAPPPEPTPAPRQEPKPAQPAPPRQQAATVTAATPATATPPALLADALYRLRRWPSSEVLRGHRYFVRLASFLSTRHVNLGELARLSNVSELECREFVLKLLTVDLLDVQQPAVASPVSGSSARPTHTTPRNPAGKRPPEPGLFSRIRQSLGMGQR